MVVPHEHERVQFSASGARTASDVHPLVLLANLKLHAAQPPAGELGLERLTEWLATRTGLRYLRIDPTRIDVARSPAWSRMRMRAGTASCRWRWMPSAC